MSNFRDHADKGFEVVADTNAHNIRAYGISVIATAVIAAITFEDGYDGDADIVGVSLPVGYYPMQIKTIDLTSGTIICWLKQ